MIYAPEFKAGEFLHSKDFFTVDKSNISVPSWRSRIWNDFFDNKQQKAKLSDCQRERTAILTFYDPRIHYFGGPLGRLISTIQGKHKRNWISSPFLSKLRNILLRPTTCIVFVDLQSALCGRVQVRTSTKTLLKNTAWKAWTPARQSYLRQQHGTIFHATFLPRYVQIKQN